MYTKNTEGTFRIDMNFDNMCRITDAAKSWNPSITTIIEQEYKQYHPFENGTSIYLKRIRHDSYKSVSEEEFKKNLSEHWSRMYHDIIRSGVIELKIDGITVPKYEWFHENNNCTPFNQTMHYYIVDRKPNANKQKNKNIGRFVAEFTNYEGETNLFQYNHVTEKWNKLNTSIVSISETHNFQYKCAPKNYACTITTTFAMFHPDFKFDEGQDKLSDEQIDKQPKGVINLRKNGRVMSALSDQAHASTYYNQAIIDFNSKPLYELIGGTYFKKVKVENDITKSIMSLVKKRTHLIPRVRLILNIIK